MRLCCHKRIWPFWTVLRTCSLLSLSCSKVAQNTGSYQGRIKLRERIPHIGPIPIVIPLKLFLERTGLPTDNISYPRKKDYPPLELNENSFRDFFKHISFDHVSIGIHIDKQKIVRRFTKEIKFERKC